MIAMLRSELIKAQNYTGEDARDLRMEAFKAVLDGEMRMLVTVERAHDILTTLRL
ncbi:MAG TPA: amidohydrolase, partial [Bacteroidetes bacterium]|nr:amidohydrolase [Bacteroidota bacterium]